MTEEELGKLIMLQVQQVAQLASCALGKPPLRADIRVVSMGNNGEDRTIAYTTVLRGGDGEMPPDNWNLRRDDDDK